MDKSNENFNERLQLFYHLIETISLSSLDYQKEIDTYNHDDTFLELTSKNGQDVYRELKKLLKESKIDEYSTRSSVCLGNIKSCLTKSLTTILGEDITPDLKIFKRKIIPIKYPILTDAMVNVDLNKEGIEKILEVCISDKFDEIQLAPLAYSFVNEYISQYKKEKFNQVFANKNYEKLLPLLIEKLAIIESQDDMFDKTILEKIERERTNEAKSSVLRNDTYLSSFDEIENMLEHINSDIVESLKYKQKAMERWIIHENFALVIGDIYTSRLAELYSDDKTNMRNIIRSIYKGQKSILELLLEYSVSITNKETIKSYQKKIERLSNK